MGIPFFFRTLVNRHPEIVRPVNTLICDRLFLDFNSMIHNAAQYAFSINIPTQEMDAFVIKNCIERLCDIIKVCNPKKLVYVAVDGIAPVAKMIQQRKRRYVNAWKKTIFNQTDIWDTNCITPGTQFMIDLDKHLKVFAEQKNNIIISGSNEIGEGEHKIMRYIKHSINSQAYSDVIYGLDADLIMLGMLSKNSRNINLLRETIEFGPLSTRQTSPFQILSIAKLSIYINTCYNQSNIDHTLFLKDYVILCSILGNDFVPPLSYLKIKDNGIDIILKAHQETYKELKGCLVDEKDNLNIVFLKSIFTKLSQNEDINMNEACHKYYNSTVNMNFRPRSSIMDKQLFEFNNLPILNKAEFKIDPSEQGWRLPYYKHLFNVINQKEIIQICESYIQGLIWVCNYYLKYDSMITTSSLYHYPYHYSPTIWDLNTYLVSMKSLDCKQDDCVKIDSDIQLLMVLPPQSIKLVKPKLQHLMTDISYGCLHYYPHTFKITKFLKQYIWECSPEIPNIDIHHIYKTVKSIKL